MLGFHVSNRGRFLRKCLGTHTALIGPQPEMNTRVIHECESTRKLLMTAIADDFPIACGKILPGYFRELGGSE